MIAQDFWQNFRLGTKRRYLHTTSPVLRKCCGCIHLRAGSMITCFVWMGLSMYFAVVSFQHKSPFFSYMSDAGILVFGTCNLFFAIMAGYAAFTLFHNQFRYIEQVALWMLLAVAIVLIDTTVNVVIFIVIRSDYEAWCVGSAYQYLEQGVEVALNTNNTNINFFTDFYNCNRTWEDELKFSILCCVMMIVFYIYWAICFYSYSMKKRANVFQPALMQGQFADPVLHQLNNPIASTSAGYMAPPFERNRSSAGDGGEAPVIVLSNAKPSGKSKKDKHRSSASTATAPPPYEGSNHAFDAAAHLEMAEKGHSPVIVFE
ncbi:hypothetical protein BC940DRAFT_298649 [Gongronella butleri]|nr:hypothetical protein BC940DRAFT_298649 [Gongronella butleri]